MQLALFCRFSQLDDELKGAYYLLNEYRDFNASATIEDAADQLDDLIVRFKNYHCEEYLRVAQCLTNWRDEIINSFNRINNHVISNGAMERINRDAKTIIRNSFGIRNFVQIEHKNGQRRHIFRSGKDIIPGHAMT